MNLEIIVIYFFDTIDGASDIIAGLEYIFKFEDNKFTVTVDNVVKAINIFYKYSIHIKSG